MPLISVITPIYNGERFIEDCINNVVRQNCPDAEHIIIDGGSTDSSVDIIRQYAADFHHIRWISEKDQGQSDAMNKGIALAKGLMIGFLNVDDYYEPGVINRVAQIFDTVVEPSLLVGNCKVWGVGGELLLINRPMKLRLKDLLLGSKINQMPLNPSAYFYHKSLHEIIGPFDATDHYTMDWDFILRAVQHANVIYIDEIWGNFRMIPGTKTMDDISQDLSSNRQKKILTRYRKDLPISDRLLVFTLYSFQQFIGSIRYFVQKPGEFPKRFWRRLVELFRLA